MTSTVTFKRLGEDQCQVVIDNKVVTGTANREETLKVMLILDALGIPTRVEENKT